MLPQSCFVSRLQSPFQTYCPISQVSPPGRECIGKFFNKFYVHLLTWHARTTTETTSSLRVASFSFIHTHTHTQVQLHISWSPQQKLWKRSKNFFGSTLTHVLPGRNLLIYCHTIIVLYSPRLRFTCGFYANLIFTAKLLVFITPLIFIAGLCAVLARECVCWNLCCHECMQTSRGYYLWCVYVCVWP